MHPPFERTMFAAIQCIDTNNECANEWESSSSDYLCGMRQLSELCGVWHYSPREHTPPRPRARCPPPSTCGCSNDRMQGGCPFDER